MLTLFCLCAALWAQATNREAFGWGFGACFTWVVDLLFFVAVFGGRSL